MQKGRFSNRKESSRLRKSASRLNLSLLELQFSFSEWLTDNSWKENDIFSAAEQELQIEASAHNLGDCYFD